MTPHPLASRTTRWSVAGTRGSLDIRTSLSPSAQSSSETNGIGDLPCRLFFPRETLETYDPVSLMESPYQEFMSLLFVAQPSLSVHSSPRVALYSVRRASRSPSRSPANTVRVCRSTQKKLGTTVQICVRIVVHSLHGPVEDSLREKERCGKPRDTCTVEGATVWFFDKING